MKGKYLKKWMSVFLSTALAISSISGCGNSDKEPTDSTDKYANETTDTANRITYAALAEEEQETAVNIAAGAGLNITSNNGVQEVGPNKAITDIIV